MRWLDSITHSMYMSQQTPEDTEGQGSLVSAVHGGLKESDTT